MTGMLWPVVIFMAISLAIGLYTYTQVQGSSKRYTVCGKSMPFLVVGTALAAQAIDGNATLGEGKIPGTEYLAYSDDGSGSKNVTLLVQVPAARVHDDLASFAETLIQEERRRVAEARGQALAPDTQAGDLN